MASLLALFPHIQLAPLHLHTSQTHSAGSLHASVRLAQSFFASLDGGSKNPEPFAAGAHVTTLLSHLSSEQGAESNSEVESEEDEEEGSQPEMLTHGGASGGKPDQAGPSVGTGARGPAQQPTPHRMNDGAGPSAGPGARRRGRGAGSHTAATTGMEEEEEGVSAAGVTARGHDLRDEVFDLVRPAGWVRELEDPPGEGAWGGFVEVWGRALAGVACRECL